MSCWRVAAPTRISILCKRPTLQPQRDCGRPGTKPTGEYSGRTFVSCLSCYSCIQLTALECSSVFGLQTCLSWYSRILLAGLDCSDSRQNDLRDWWGKETAMALWNLCCYSSCRKWGWPCLPLTTECHQKTFRGNQVSTSRLVPFW